MAVKDPTIWILAQAVQDCIQAVDGTGDWNYDLSGSDTVTFDERIGTKQLKVIVGPLVISPDDADLHVNRKTIEYYIFGSVGVQSGYSSRLEANTRLAHDIARSLSTSALKAATDAVETDRGYDIFSTRIDTLQCGGLPDYNNLGTLQMILSIRIQRNNSGPRGGF